MMKADFQRPSSCRFTL